MKLIRNLFSLRAANLSLIVTSAIIAFGTFPEQYNILPFPARDLFRSKLFIFLCAYIALSTVLILFTILRRNARRKKQAIAHIEEKSVSQVFRKELHQDSLDSSAAVKTVISNLKLRRYEVLDEDDSDRVRITARKNAWGAWGSTWIHFGMILCLFAGAITFLRADVRDIMLPEGETITVPGTESMIRLEKFTTILYPRTDKPEEYISRLLVQEKGGQPYRYMLKVNNPLLLEDTKIFQMRYRVEILKVILTVSRNGEYLGKYDLVPEKRTAIGESGIEIQVNEVNPDFAIDKAGNVSSRTPYFQNPAVHISVYESTDSEKAVLEKWVFEAGNTHHKEEGVKWSLGLERIKKRYISGFKLSNDPGVPWAYMGFIFLCIGTFMSSFIVPRYFTICIYKKKDSEGTVFLELWHKSRREGPKLKSIFNRIAEQITNKA